MTDKKKAICLQFEYIFTNNKNSSTTYRKQMLSLKIETAFRHFYSNKTKEHQTKKLNCVPHFFNVPIFVYWDSYPLYCACGHDTWHTF